MRLIPAALLTLSATPIVADPLVDPVVRGAEIYSDTCLECHGPTATEGEAGDIRGLGLATVSGAVRAGPGMMPSVPLASDEIAAVVAYLATLRRE